MADKTTQTTKEISLSDQLIAKRAELLEARKNLGNTLQNPHTITKLRKDIARLLTKINANPALSSSGSSRGFTDEKATKGTK
jgi:ribosomal protein L29